MRRFRYGGDPLCVVACVAYVINHWLIPATWKGWFLDDYFDDLLFIPAALPLILWVHRQVGLRAGDQRPGWDEILLHLVVWSIAAEAVAPHFFTHAVGDPWDVVAYACGAVVAGVLWHRVGHEL